MLVRAVATATERSNAIGSIELECTDSGLVMIYHGVGAFAAGYATGALTTDTRVVVPWSHVLEARFEGDQLWLHIDAAVTPHNRLSLHRFASGDTADFAERQRQRGVIRVAALAAIVVTVLAAAITVPRISPRAGAIATLLVGATGASGVLGIGLLADRYVAAGGRSPRSVREAFAMELAAFYPGLVRTRSRAAPKKKDAIDWTALGALLPRTTTAIAITMTACLLGAVLTVRYVLTNGDRSGRIAARDSVRDRSRPLEPELTDRSVPEDAPPKKAAPPAPRRKPEPTAKRTIPSGDVAQSGGACQCKHGESPMWSRGLPKLSLLTFNRRVRRDGTRKRMSLDLAAVNNGDEEMNELSLVVQFFDVEPPPSNKLVPSQARAVYFEGPLSPGAAIKWSVEARGSAYAVENPVKDRIGRDGRGAATADQIALLLNANNRPVRLHGAMLLAYLGDARAKEAALKLKDALREDEAPYLSRLLRAVSAVRTCNLKVTGSGVKRSAQACVYNASDAVQSNLALRGRALDASVDHQLPVDAPPRVVGESTWALPNPLEPQTGVVVQGTLTLDSATDPAAYEAFADRADLLP